MPTRKIREPDGSVSWSHREKAKCQDPDHRADPRVDRSPGVYEHTCPACGFSYTFHVGETFHY